MAATIASAIARSTGRRVLTVFSKPVCGLCDEAKEAIDAVVRETGADVDVQTVNIDAPDHADWRRRYAYDIPVIHLDGQMVMKHRVDPARLRRLLTERAPASAP